MGGLETARDDAAESGEELKVSGFATSATPADGAAAAAADGKAGGGAPAGFGASPPADPTAVAGPAASAALGDDRGVPSERSEAIFAWAATTAGVSGNPGVESMPLEREILRSRCRLFWNHTCTWRAETPSFLESSMRVCRPVDARGKGGIGVQPPWKWSTASGVRFPAPSASGELGDSGSASGHSQAPPRNSRSGLALADSPGKGSIA